uniref:Neur_chan_LBD domain-containing protein n=1 Tax=Macrostomum lignano TaxID=282301 RepID=A0A1I8IGA6_9PLAT
RLASMQNGSASKEIHFDKLDPSFIQRMLKVQLNQLLPVLLLLPLLCKAGADDTESDLRQIFVKPLDISANLTIEQIANMLLFNYDNYHRPGYSGAATRVEINLFVQSFGSISVIDMDYSIDILLRQKWTDPRLRFKGYNRSLSLSYLKQKLWIPDLTAFLHEITTPNYLIWLDPNGLLTVRLACPMQLWNFPMDTQLCPLEIGSYGFALSDLEFVWMTDRAPVSLNKQMMLNEFEIPEVRAGSCNKAYNTTGQFACLFVEFKLERKFGFYLIYTYLPSILIVAISWISFWIDYKAVPARITLGLLSVLALMTQASATVQFALVNMIARRRERRQARDDLRGTMTREMRMLRGNLLPQQQKRPRAQH